MKLKQVEFFYDVVSPYSLLAFEVLQRYTRAWGADPGTFLRLRPFFLGGVMGATGNAPPAALPARARYLQKDMHRNSHFFGVPMQTPSKFPSNTLTAMRVLTAIQHDQPEAVAPASRALWRAFWQNKEDIEDLAVIQAAVQSGSGASAEQAATWVKRAGDQSIKDALKATTEEAIERGAFGAPTWFVHCDGKDTNIFFGSDRFEMMASMYDLPWYGPLGPPDTSAASGAGGAGAGAASSSLTSKL